MSLSNYKFVEVIRSRLIGGGLALFKQTIGSLWEPMADKASWENDLSMAPMDLKNSKPFMQLGFSSKVPLRVTSGRLYFGSLVA